MPRSPLRLLVLTWLVHALSLGSAIAAAIPRGVGPAWGDPAPLPPYAHPRLVRVDLSGDLGLDRLIEAGLDVLEVRRGDHCVILERPQDRATLDRLGANRVVLDDDPGRTAALRTRAELARRPPDPAVPVRSAARPDGVTRIEMLPPFGSGSFAGYWTLEEVKMKLDSWVDSDANDVVADKLDTLGWSIQGRPIWGLKLAKAVQGPDTRPVAFFNALTHAREPAGMEALLYWVDDLLARYGIDPFATYLLDHRVLYLVPVVNPDGYRVNQDYWFTTGTFTYHRKNVRDTNGNGLLDPQVDGVDVNRNYGIAWGQPGASGNPADETYYGAAPFSEPETQAQRDVVAMLQPRTGISFHTYGDLLIHPWGYTTSATPDSQAFFEWSDDMTLGNGYHSGQGIRVLYQVSGEFTDWCYGDVALKPRMFAWTAEVGNPTDQFWPPPSRLLPLAQENVRKCDYAAAIAGPHVRLESFRPLEGALNRGAIAHLTLRARNRGLSGSAGPGLVATLSSLSAGAHVIQGSISLPTLGSFESGEGSGAVVAADDTVTLGRALRFQVDFTAPDGFFSRDTLDLFCGTPTVLLADDAEAGLGNWTTRSWGIESGDPAHPSNFFSDSPGGVYGRNDNHLTLVPSLDLSKAKHAYAQFQTRWEFETDYDCGAVQLTTQTGQQATWTSMPGQSTTASFGAQIPGPVYEGARRTWKNERVDLSSFAGPGATAVRLRFFVHPDGAEFFDGFRVDSVRVLSFDPAAQPQPVAVGGSPATDLDLGAASPNPARGPVRLAFSLPRSSAVRLEVLDLQGRRVRTLVDRRLERERYQFGWDLRDDRERPVRPGLYLIRLSDGERAVTSRLAVLR